MITKISVGVDDGDEGRNDGLNDNDDSDCNSKPVILMIIAITIFTRLISRDGSLYSSNPINQLSFLCLLL